MRDYDKIQLLVGPKKVSILLSDDANHDSGGLSGQRSWFMFEKMLHTEGALKENEYLKKVIVDVDGITLSIGRVKNNG